MLGCLISLLIAAIIALIVLLIVEWVLAQFIPISARIISLVRVLVGLLLLLYFVECALGGGSLGWYPGHRL